MTLNLKNNNIIEKVISKYDEMNHFTRDKQKR